MSRFTALYAVYGKTPPFVDLAAHALSGEAATPGQSPINLIELNYDLTKQTEPDAAQVISLLIGEEVIEGQPTPAPLKLRVGDSMKVRTGIILDHNGHPVPDGTRVSFIFQYDDGTAATIQDTTTQDGVAQTGYVLNRTGRLLVRARSEPALSSITLQITISESGSFVVATLAPTRTPTITPSPTPTSTPSPTPTVTPTPVPGFMQTWFVEKPKYAQWNELVLALIGVLLIGGGSYWRARNGHGDLSAALRTGLWAAIGGLMAYVLFDLGVPGSDWLRSMFGAGAALIVALIGGAIPWMWLMRRQPR
jgi:beta-N-acetylhexosaminidase